MSVLAQTADGVQHEFPDGTDPAVIDKVMADYTASAAPAKSLPGNTPAPDPSSMSLGDRLKTSLGVPKGSGPDLGDIATGASTGVLKGVEGIPGIPGSVQSMGNSLVDRIMLGAGHKIMDWTGYGPQAGTPQRAEFDKLYTGIGSDAGLPTASDTVGYAAKALGELPDAKTPAGKMVQRGAEMIPGAAAFGGGPGVGAVGRVVGDWLLPYIFSEGAGAAATGTKYEDAARMAGALAGNVGTGAARAYTNAPDRMVQNATRSVTPAQWDAAGDVQALGVRTGVPLSGPEAIAQAAGGSKATDILRTVEGSTHGGDVTQAFFGQRPDQVGGAVGRALDTVGPQDARPSTLGPRAAAVAQDAIDTTEHGINTATRPAYAAAEPQTIDPANFPTGQRAAFQDSLQRLRTDTILGPEYANMPDNSVGVIDAVTKDMRSRGIALENAANPGFNPQKAGIYGRDASDARDIARDPARGGVQAYDDALTAQEQARRQNLEPLQQGPVGTIANVGGGGAGTLSGTDAAAKALLPPAGTAVGGQREIQDAVARMVMASGRDPNVVPSLVRQGLANSYDQAASGPMNGLQEYAGAKFRAGVYGSPQQRDNLAAALGALPNGPATANGFDDLMTVLQATGQRKQPNSATAFNQEFMREMGESPLEIATHAWTVAQDRVRRAMLGHRQSSLAEMFTAPDSVQQMRGISERQLGTPVADALLRSAAQNSATAGGR